MKCIGAQSKLKFVLLMMWKVQKVESINIQSDCKTISKDRTDFSSVFLHVVEKYEKVDSVNTQNYFETMSKKWTDKKKTNLFCVFCGNV